MGYAGNKEPQFIIPSAIAVKETAKVNTLRVKIICFFSSIIIPGSQIRTSLLAVSQH